MSAITLNATTTPALAAINHIAQPITTTYAANNTTATTTNNNEAIHDLLSTYDDVVFDFSSPSRLVVSWYDLVIGSVTERVHSVCIPPASSTSASSSSSCNVQDGRDISAIYRWCAEQAGFPASHQQQDVFRFEFGRYASAEKRRNLMVIHHEESN